MQQREHSRYRIWFPVQLTTDQLEAMAVNHNISAGGMLIAISAELKVGEPVQVSFRVPPRSDEERTVTGKIVRIEENEEDPEGMWPYRIAVSFEEVDGDLVPFLEEAANHLAELS